MRYLTGKFGPLPGWAWIALGVAGFLAWRYFSAAGRKVSTAGGTAPGQLTPDSQTALLDTLGTALGLLSSGRPGGYTAQPPAATPNFGGGRARSLESFLSQFGGKIPDPARNAAGPQIFSDIFGKETQVGNLPFNTPVQFSGPAVTSGGKWYFPIVGGGYVNASDLTFPLNPGSVFNIPTPAGAPATGGIPVGTTYSPPAGGALRVGSPPVAGA